METRELVFGRFRFDFEHSLLFRDGVPVNLGRRGEQILAALLRRRGEVLTKADLLDAAWPGESVEESNLSVQVAMLRKKLGRSPEDADWIATVSRVGYRFSPARETVSHNSSRHDVPLLAILPFADLSAGGAHAQLADGFVEDLTTTLSRFKSIRVAARNSSFQYDGRAADVREVARNLGVRYVLEGSVRQMGGRVRTSAQLIDGATGSHVWAETFDTQAGETPEDDLTDPLAAAVEAHVHAAEIARSHRERPTSAEAYDLYLRARLKIQSSRPGDNAAGYGLYLKALELEPENTIYLAGAAEALHHRRAVGWPVLETNDRKKSLELGLRGLDRINADAVSLALFGNAMFTAHEEDLGSALTERAIALNDKSPLALICGALSQMWAGSLDEAETLFTRSVRLNPTDPNQRFALAGLASIHRIREDFERSFAYAKRAYAVSPGYSNTHWHLIAASAHLGRMEDARRYFDRYRVISPDVTIDSIRAGQPYKDRSRLASLLEGLRLAGLPER